MLLYLCPQITGAQETREYSNSIRLGIIPIVRGGFHLSYERIMPRQSVVFIGEATALKISSKKISGQMAEVQYRFINLDVNFGAGYKSSVIGTDRLAHSYDDNIFSPGYTGIGPAGNITFGIKF